MSREKCSVCRRKSAEALAAAFIFLLGMCLPAYAQSPGFSTGQPDGEGSKVSPWLINNLSTATSNGFFVILREAADLHDARLQATRTDRQRFVYEKLRVSAEKSQQPLRRWLDAQGIAYRPFYIVNMLLVYGGPELVSVIAARPDVLRIEGNPTVRGIDPVPIETVKSSAPASPNAVEWGITNTRAPEVWASGINGAGIVVAGCDTGIQWDHPALKEKYRGWTGSAADHNYSWHDAVHGSGANPCGYDTTAPCDDYGHGTHTIGTAVGDDGGANQIGMAPGAQWIGCRNMDSGAGTPARYLECFEFFLAPYPLGESPATGDPSKAPHIINNSWSCTANEGCSHDTLRLAVESLRAAGIAVVASAGNAGSSCGSVADPPAIYEASFSVGAADSTGAIASFSSRGPVMVDGSSRLKPDITAPGVNIRSAAPGNGYASMSGTSMASPHAAGAIALLWSGVPALIGNIDATESILKNNADTSLPYSSQTCGGIPATQVPNNIYGAGLLDVYSAVEFRLVNLHVSKNGAGSGTVASNPPGIGCGAVCSDSFTWGDVVTLAAATDAGSRFAGWSGGGCSGTDNCSLTMNSELTITATFEPEGSTTTTAAATTSSIAATTTIAVPGCIDTDNDGYGSNYVQGADCNDAAPEINPGQDEICGDGIDNNCNGLTDEDCPPKKCPIKNALGSDNPKLLQLQAFRDNTLAKNALGRKVIHMYYGNARSINAVLDRSPLLRAAFRTMLELFAPLVGKLA
jgi:subtilisin family serine protease